MASEDPGPIVIRDPVPDDEGAWRNLWAGYCAFYETKLPEAVTAATWARMLTPGSQLFGRLAEWKGEVAGFTISVLHASTWTLAPICYLEDLFVTARGHGLRAHRGPARNGKARGWARLYWHTRQGNETARRLYDKFAGADDFVRYRLILS